MKKQRRDRALRPILRQLGSADFDTRENALFQLALLLQRARAAPLYPDAPDLYSENLSRELRRIRPSLAEQGRIADAINQLIAQYPANRATAIWALAALSPEIGLPFVLELIRDVGEALDQEAAFQACRAVWRWLAEDLRPPPAVLQLPQDNALLPQLRTWQGSADDRLAAAAESAIDSLRRLRGGDV